MGIVRTVEWKLTVPPDEADGRLREALLKLDMNPEGGPGHIRAKSEHSLRKNRWATDVGIELETVNGGTVAVARVDMVGNKHYALLDEIAENAGDDLFDDRGSIALNAGEPARDAEDDAGASSPRADCLADEVMQHFLGDLEITDDPVAKRAHCSDRSRRATDHLFRLRPGRKDFRRVLVDCDHRWLEKHDSLALYEDDRVRSAQVDGEAAASVPEQARRSERQKDPFQQER